jgi:hypothetical protein
MGKIIKEDHKLAKEYGISDVRIAKICKKLGVPVPGRGCWAKKDAGRVVGKRPSSNESTIVWFLLGIRPYEVQRPM